MQHEAQRIDQEVPLLTLDQLAGIKAVRVDASAPFSALFTLWLSITQTIPRQSGFGSPNPSQTKGAGV